MTKSKLPITKIYVLKITAVQEKHNLVYEFLKRFLYTEKIKENTVDVTTV